MRKEELVHHLKRQRERVQAGKLPAEALHAIDRDTRILERARGETVEEMRRYHDLARNLTHYSALAVGTGICVSTGLTLTNMIPAQAFTASVAGMGVLGLAVAAGATFLLQKPAVAEVLNDMNAKIDDLAHQGPAETAEHQVERLAKPSQPEEAIVFEEDGLHVGDVFLPIERDQNPFHF